MKKICIFFINYGPYHFARVKATYDIFNSQKYHIFGLELARQEAEYSWTAEINNTSFILHSLIEKRLLQEVPIHQVLYYLILILHKLNPDVIAISGYSHPAMILSLLWCSWRKKIPILLSETTEQDFKRRPWQEKIKAWIIKSYQAALVGGEPHKQYLVKLGLKSESVFTGYDVVDNGTFSPSRIRFLPPPIESKYFLAVNRFIPKKNLLNLLKAYSLYLQFMTEKPWHLVLSGDGKLKPEIEKTIISLDLASVVHLTGFLQQEQLLPYFAHAQYFIHASTTEQWGLVVNEAMAAGLPVLVSNRCGCFEDLVLEGINGFGFDPYDIEALANLMFKMSSDEVNLEKMGDASLKHIQNFTPQHFATGLMQAIDYALSHR